MASTPDRWAVSGAKTAVAAMLLIVAAVIVLNSDIVKGGQQFTNTNLAAPFSALGFLAGAATSIFGAAAAAIAFASGHRVVARCLVAVIAVDVILYAALLIGYSETSKEVVLATGVEKYFCELDCHIAYTITSVQRDGNTVVVSLRTRFDEHTIAPWRGDAALSPDPRDIHVVDSAGDVYAPRQSSGPQLTTALRPGQSYTTEFTFEVPAGSRDPRLVLLSKAKFPERVMIGNENSFLHRKVSFRL